MASILYVLDSSATPGDEIVVDHLETEGYLVTEHDGANDPTSALSGVDAVIISTAASTLTGVLDTYVSNYRAFTGGLIAVGSGTSATSPTLWSELYLATGNLSASSRTAWFVDDSTHPTAGNLSGARTVLNDSSRLMVFAADGTNTFGAGVTKVAHLDGNTDRWVLFAYDAASALTTGSAAGRRVAATFLTVRGTEWAAPMFTMFNATVAWLTQEASEAQLATPGNFTFTASAVSRQLDGAWDAVSGADYEYQVQRSDDGVWVAFQSDTTSATSFQLTDTDGVGWGKTYRGRVRAVPEVS